MKLHTEHAFIPGDPKKGAPFAAAELRGSVRYNIFECFKNQKNRAVVLNGAPFLGSPGSHLE